MIFNDRLEFFDKCIAGEMTQFNDLISKRVFNTVDRSYELYRDYVKQKNTITGLSCKLDDDEIVVHLECNGSVDEVISANIPKRGIVSSQSCDGVDLHIKLIDIISM